MGYAQSALSSMALMEPSLIIPELLERAYGGLEVVNETHRTTAVLGMLSRISRPLVTEKVWLGGQKHVVPLLDLCIPGIDLVRPPDVFRFISTLTNHLRTIRLKRYAQPCSLLPQSSIS
jgi:proteasome activator subunit 4